MDGIGNDEQKQVILGLALRNFDMNEKLVAGEGLGVFVHQCFCESSSVGFDLVLRDSGCTLP